MKNALPSTVNYSVAWWVGDIGYRRPQLRLTKLFNMGSAFQLHFQLDAVRAIGGEDAGWPGFQGWTALSFPLLKGKPVSVGVSGHVGKEEADFNTWSANLDLTLPTSNWLTFTGELWRGENLDAYLGGIGQGLRCIDVDGDGTNECPVEGIVLRGGRRALFGG
ncbi:hypothetical protein HYR99_04390 [Candidatus Poribacteria bacterium]|nr:hypothetical protein [Candidatus Poribacteria bacterium]